MLSFCRHFWQGKHFLTQKTPEANNRGFSILDRNYFTINFLFEIVSPDLILTI